MTETPPEPAPLLSVDCWLVDVRGLDAEVLARWDAAEATERERAARYATMALRALTAGAVEPCVYRWAPTRACGCAEPTWRVYPVVGHGSTFSPRLDSGTWINVRCGSCGWASGTYRADEVRIPGATAIVTVTVEGVLVDGSEYTFARERLRRTSGEAWPASPDDFEVLYYGRRPGADGEQAAGRLAVEYLDLLLGGDCQLPDTATSVTRAGTSIVLSPGAFPNGLSGVREVDAWVASINPYGLKMQSAVLSPDFSS